MTANKDAAFAFLSSIEADLDKGLKSAADTEAEIRALNAASKTDNSRRHLRQPESAFLNHWVIPALVQRMKLEGLSDAQIRVALLNEYYRNMPDTSSMTPARTVKHPFSKVQSATAASIYDGWLNAKNESALVQSCPDFALRSPCPHKIVFEGKYFGSGSQKHANAQLVKDIYQAFFYRALPFVKAKEKPARPAWDYDYACLVAFDASNEGTLKKAWLALPARVRKGFWEGANIYVMIVGGDGRPK